MVSRLADPGSQSRNEGLRDNLDGQDQGGGLIGGSGLLRVVGTLGAGAQPTNPGLGLGGAGRGILPLD